jgi:YD repeat-containing protein
MVRADDAAEALPALDVQHRFGLGRLNNQLIAKVLIRRDSFDRLVHSGVTVASLILTLLLGMAGQVAGGDFAGGDFIEQVHNVDARNEIEDVAHDAEIDGTPSSSTEDTVYDVNGNLVADGSFYYQYDAWNRLLRVSHVGDLTFNADSSIDDGEPGDWIVEFVYDALGRLIVTRHNWGGGDMRQAEYFYDGVRRIAEVFTDLIEGDGGSRPIGVACTNPA